MKKKVITVIVTIILCCVLLLTLFTVPTEKMYLCRLKMYLKTYHISYENLVVQSFEKGILRASNQTAEFSVKSKSVFWTEIVVKEGDLQDTIVCSLGGKLVSVNGTDLDDMIR